MSEEPKAIPVRIAKPTATDMEATSKPIHAELVRADKIRPGDRVLFAGEILTVKSVHTEPEFSTRGFAFEGFLNETWCDDDFDDDQLVARVDPENERLRELCGELVGALEDALRTCESDMQHVLDNGRLRDVMRAALAKAKGGDE